MAGIKKALVHKLIKSRYPIEKILSGESKNRFFAVKPGAGYPCRNL